MKESIAIITPMQGAIAGFQAGIKESGPAAHRSILFAQEILRRIYGRVAHGWALFTLQYMDDRDAAALPPAMNFSLHVLIRYLQQGGVYTAQHFPGARTDGDVLRGGQAPRAALPVGERRRPVDKWRRPESLQHMRGSEEAQAAWMQPAMWHIQNERSLGWRELPRDARHTAGERMNTAWRVLTGQTPMRMEVLYRALRMHTTALATGRALTGGRERVEAAGGMRSGDEGNAPAAWRRHADAPRGRLQHYLADGERLAVNAAKDVQRGRGDALMKNHASLSQTYTSRLNKEWVRSILERRMEHLTKSKTYRPSQNMAIGAIAGEVRHRETSREVLEIAMTPRPVAAALRVAAQAPVPRVAAQAPTPRMAAQAPVLGMTAQPAMPSTAETAAVRRARGDVFQPAVMTMLMPPAYVGRYGKMTPIAEEGRQAPAGGEAARAQDFFRLRAKFDEELRRRGGSVPMQVARYPYSELAYKQNEGDITKKLLSQQAAKPRSLNDTLSVKAKAQEGKREKATMSREELAKVTDSVYSMLESRIKAERRRFGY